MNWYKVRTRDEEGKGYTYVGSSPDTPDMLAEKTGNGAYLKLENLLYCDDDGEIKEWKEWDSSILPVVYINPKSIFSFMQFKCDPRIIPHKRDNSLS